MEMEFSRNEDRKYAMFVLAQGNGSELLSFIVELYSDSLPNTSENFEKLISGTHAAGQLPGTCIHRICRGAFIQVSTC
jgi:cyclophilin family peptidyl-prolyl cis-trans isomerase